MTEYTAITGNVATEPTVQKTQAGATMTRFRVACPNRQRDVQTGEWVDRESSWFTVFAYGSLAENAMKTLSKGMRVIAAGQLKVRDWAKDDRSGTSAEVHADSLGLDLRWGKSTFERTAGGGRKSDENSPHQDEQLMSAVEADGAGEGAAVSAGDEVPIEADGVQSADADAVPTPF
ncbi:MAG: single-stranded DNA-binding protein [Microbacterium gubbeenense]